MSNNFLYQKKLKYLARNLRRQQTDVESLLWSKLRRRQLGGYKFHRQFPIDSYIVDFYCHEKRLAIELDGGQHTQAYSKVYDKVRAEKLKSKGISVIRFWDNDIFLNINGVLEKIHANLKTSPSPSPNRRGKKNSFSSQESERNNSFSSQEKARMRSKRKGRIFQKIIAITLINIFLTVNVLNIPYLIFDAINNTENNFAELNPLIDEAQAEYNYSATETIVTTANGTAGNYLDTRTSDADYMRILNTASGLDASFTFNGVKLFNANRLIVMYDGSSSTTGLAYQIQIRDYKNNLWRNIIPHEATYNNTTQAAANLILVPGTTGATGGGYFEIYDGYFSNGSNTPIATPLSNFVNNNQQVMVRFYSASTTANLELDIDYLAVQAANTPMYYASSMTLETNKGTVQSGTEYNDTTHDDATTNLQINAGSAGLDGYLSFMNVSIPYANANTYLVEFSALRNTLANYSVYLRDFVTGGGEWDLLSTTALTATTDDTYYFSLVPSTLSQNMTDYIQNGEMRVRVASAGTSGYVQVDFVRVTIGSTATNVSPYVGSISRGSTNSGDATNTRTLDTSQALSGWIIDSSITDARTTTEFYGDCNAPTTNHCAAANINLPVNPPNNSIVEGLIVAYRFNTSNAALDLTWSVRNYAGAYQDITTPPADQSNIATNIMHIQELSNPMRPQIGEGLLTTIPTFTQQRYVEDATNNAVNLRFRTTTSDTSARTVTWDFAFASIKTIVPQNKNTHRFTPDGATLTYGTNNASNWRFTKGDDTFNWAVTANGTNGTDVYLSFSGVSVPGGANKLIVTSKQSFSAASTAYTMWLYDFSGAGTWRNIVPHASNFTSSGTGGTRQYTQFEIFNGYFSDGSNNAVSTPLSNFVSSGEARLRITSASTTSSLGWDFAQVQFVTDPGYHPSALSVTAPATLTANEYNDVFTDDNTSNVQVTPSGNAAELFFTFSNVIIPPEGFNAIWIESGVWKTTAGSYDLQIKNVRTNSYENVSTGVTRTGDTTDYFIFNVGDWGNYISSTGTIVFRFYSSGNNNAVNIDFLQITLGTVPGSGTTVESYYGATVNGSASSLSNLDTYSSTDELNGANFLTVTSANPTSQIPAISEMGGKELEVNFPFHVDPGTSVAGIIWMYRGQTGSTTLTMTPSIQEVGGHYRTMTTALNSLYTLLALNALPTVGDTTTLAIASQALRQGWYTDQIEDLWKSSDKRLRFRLYTSTGLVNTTDTKLIVDAVFYSYRYVQSKISPAATDQMRHGKWWFAGGRQKESF